MSCNYHDDCNTCDITKGVPYCKMMQENSKSEADIMGEKRQRYIKTLKDPEKFKQEYLGSFVENKQKVFQRQQYPNCPARTFRKLFRPNF